MSRIRLSQPVNYGVTKHREYRYWKKVKPVAIAAALRLAHAPQTESHTVAWRNERVYDYAEREGRSGRRVMRRIVLAESGYEAPWWHQWPHLPVQAYAAKAETSAEAGAFSWLYAALCALAFFLIPPAAFAQNLVDVHVHSEPSHRNSFAKVTFRDTLNNNVFSAFTDSVSGNVCFSLPSGVYEQRTEQAGCATKLDTLVVDGYRSIDALMLEDFDTGGTVYADSSGIYVTEVLTSTRGSPWGSNRFIVNYGPRPIIRFNINPHNDTIPNSALDSSYTNRVLEALSEITNGTDSVVQFRVVDNDSINPFYSVNISWEPTTDPMYGNHGWTQPYFDNEKRIGAKIMIWKYVYDDLELRQIIRREVGRALGLESDSQEPLHVMSDFGGLKAHYHVDELKAMRLANSVPNRTNMWNYKNIIPTTIVGINNNDPMPKRHLLEQNYPNPFNNTTTIRYNLDKPSRVTLKLYNIIGQEVQTIVNNEQQGAGMHERVLNMHNKASGTYIYRIESDGKAESRKLQYSK